MIDNQRDYYRAVNNLASKLAKQDGSLRPEVSHVNQAKRELWPQLTPELQGRLVLR